MRIVVLSDGETWEVMNPEVLIVDITDEQFEKLESGIYPKSMSLSGVRVEDLLNLCVEHKFVTLNE
jgi:hypothetical protein